MTTAANHIDERVAEGRRMAHVQRADRIVTSLMLLASGPIVAEAHQAWAESRSTARYIVDPTGMITFAEGGWYDRPEVGGVGRFVRTQLQAWESYPEHERARDWLIEHPNEATVSYMSSTEGLGSWFVTVTRLSSGHFGVACKLLDHTHLGGPDVPADAE